MWYYFIAGLIVGILLTGTIDYFAYRELRKRDAFRKVKLPWED